MRSKQKSAREIAEQLNTDVSLVRAIIRKVSRESLEDVVNHGADSGFCGFSYYSDTSRFFRNHRKAIVAMVLSDAEAHEQSPVDFVASFNCLAGRELSEVARRMGGAWLGSQRYDAAHAERVAIAEYTPSVARCLYGKLTEDDYTVENALAWYALESVARAACE